MNTKFYMWFLAFLGLAYAQQQDIIIDNQNQLIHSLYGDEYDLYHLLWDDSLTSIAQQYSGNCIYKPNSRLKQELSNVGNVALFHTNIVQEKDISEIRIFVNNENSNNDTNLRNIFQQWLNEIEGISSIEECYNHSNCKNFIFQNSSNTKYFGCGYTNCDILYEDVDRQTIVAEKVFYFICDYVEQSSEKVITGITYDDVGVFMYKINNNEKNQTNFRRLMPNGLTDNDRQSLLDLHNEYRSTTAFGNTPGEPPASNMKELSWDVNLENFAQNLVDTCVWAHASDDALYSVYPDGIGENIFAATGFDEDIDILLAGIKSWYTEYSYYNYKPFYENDCDTGKDCGHYTQIVWADSSQLGCAYAYCATMQMSTTTWTNVMFISCNYHAAGNFLGEYPYSKGSACSACSSNSDCNNGLCASSSTTTRSPTRNRSPTTRSPTRPPTRSRTPTTTRSPTRAPTRTRTPSTTRSPTRAPTRTRTPTTTRSPTRAPTRTRTPTTTRSPTRAPTRTRTPTTTRSPTRAPSRTRSPTTSSTLAAGADEITTTLDSSNCQCTGLRPAYENFCNQYTISAECISSKCAWGCA